jgi:hypothetical protein
VGKRTLRFVKEHDAEARERRIEAHTKVRCASIRLQELSRCAGALRALARHGQQLRREIDTHDPTVRRHAARDFQARRPRAAANIQYNLSWRESRPLKRCPGHRREHGVDPARTRGPFVADLAAPIVLLRHLLRHVYPLTAYAQRKPTKARGREQPVLLRQGAGGHPTRAARA